MIADAIVRSIPTREKRLLTFGFGTVACLPAAIIFAVQMAIAANLGTALAWAAMCGSSLLGSLTHACMAMSSYSGSRTPLVVADILIAVGMILAIAGLAGLSG